MLRVFVGALFTIAGVSAAAAGEPAAESKETGGSIYRVYCASCHGTQGKGDGQIADALRVRPADLTLLASHNKGKFDADRVFSIIDGRKAVKGHGGADMPIWGDAFKTSHGGYDEQAVKQKIESLVEFLESIQEKAAK